MRYHGGTGKESNQILGTTYPKGIAKISFLKFTTPRQLESYLEILHRVWHGVEGRGG